jgi:hypothetical protein
MPLGRSQASEGNNNVVIVLKNSQLSVSCELFKFYAMKYMCESTLIMYVCVCVGTYQISVCVERRDASVANSCR